MVDPVAPPPLDHALFHLTPTRTRCDLLVFSARGGGGGGEKIASGLFEPFLSHLRCARDQIPKGGYSITLRPSSHAAAWFTKPTLERFVRFVSSPEILERAVTIETEIAQIDRSIAETDQGNDESSSKVCLHRVLEMRRVVLQKEQGMAYARASVAGFDPVHVDNLLLFADSFGASRLREACLNFKELCKKKEHDKLWMDELAAMEACSYQEPYLGTSGVMLTSESAYTRNGTPVVHEGTNQLELNVSREASSHSSKNSPSSDLDQEKSSRDESVQGASDSVHGKPQLPNAWPNHPPQYFYGYHSPVSQKMPPNQGYAFPGMQVVSPYYPGYPANMQWPPEESEYGISTEKTHHRGQHRSSQSKERSSNRKVRRNKETTMGLPEKSSDQDSSNSGSESDEDLKDDVPSNKEDLGSVGTQKRSSKKKSSRTVVIRNINYISSKRRDDGKDASSGESLDKDDLFDGDFIKSKVENAVSSLQKHHKSTQRQHRKKDDVLKSSRNSDPVEHSSGRESSDAEKSNGSWDIFQNHLLKDEEPASNDLKHNDTEGVNNPKPELQIGDEYCIVKNIELTPESVPSCEVNAESEMRPKKHLDQADAVLTTERHSNAYDASRIENFECDENYCNNIKRSQNMDENLLYAQRTSTVSEVQVPLPDYTNEQSITRVHRDDDCYVIPRTDKLSDLHQLPDISIFEADQGIKVGSVPHGGLEKNEKKILIDDSYMIPTRSTVYEQSTSPWETDMDIVSGITLSASSCEISSPQEKVGTLYSCEPDDLYMVLERDSEGTFGTSWSPEIDYNAEVAYTRTSECNSVAEKTLVSSESTDPIIMPSNSKDGKKNGSTDKKSSLGKSNNITGSLGRNKYDVLSKNRKPPVVSRAAPQKSKIEKEEENRKRMEELLVERQKRIAQRSARKNAQGKATPGSLNHDKRTSQSAPQVTSRS